MKAVSSSNVIEHIASPEWNWNLPLLNVKNRGADPTKAKHQKYRLTEIKVSNEPTPKFFLPFDP